MRFRCLSAALLVCGMGLLAGCPLGFDPGLGLGSGYYYIPDGTYAGSVSATVEFWEAGELVDESSSTDGYTDATFWNGALQKDSGSAFQIGDVDFLEDGAYEIMREVYYVDYGDWGYEIAFDSTGTWNGIPMTGWEIATYWLNADGSVDLYDEIELTSEEWYDGGYWTIHSDSYANLTRGQAPTYEQPPQDLLDLKSGKVRN